MHPREQDCQAQFGIDQKQWLLKEREDALWIKRARQEEVAWEIYEELLGVWCYFNVKCEERLLGATTKGVGKRQQHQRIPERLHWGWEDSVRFTLWAYHCVALRRTELGRQDQSQAEQAERLCREISEENQ